MYIYNPLKTNPCHNKAISKFYRRQNQTKQSIKILSYLRRTVQFEQKNVKQTRKCNNK